MGNDAGGGEDGSGSGFRVVVDTYDNGGGEAPAIDIMWSGVVVAHTLSAGALATPIPQVIDPATGAPACVANGG